MECLEEERGALLPLPDPRPITAQVTPVVVDKTASIRFDTNSYSVPAKYVGETFPLKKWNTIFPGAAYVSALVDRFVQHCHVMDIDADSWREKQARGLRP